MHAPVPICRWLARVLTSIAVAAAGGAQAGAPRGGPAATSAGAGVLATRAGPRPWSVVVEDDGRVAYAYLLRDGKIATDVWLYNHASAPDSFDPAERGKPPRNPAKYCTIPPPEPIHDDREVEAVWDAPGGEVKSVTILVRGALAARLAPNVRPGWSAGAARDGPAARVLARTAGK
jgi:hypothetical protein